MLDQINDYASSVSSVDDQLGLNFYASSAGASAIRDKMSGKPVNDPRGLAKKGVEGLTRVTSMRLPDNVVLYRGVAVPKDSQLANLKPGDKLTDPSFMSTSLKETAAHQFMKVQSGSARTERVLLEIESTGLTGAPFYAISGDGLISSNLLNTTYGEREAEVLLGAKNELTVASVETKTRYDHAAKKNVTYSIVRLRAFTSVDGADTSAAPTSVVENSTGAQTSVQPLATPAPPTAPTAPTFSKFPAATYATNAKKPPPAKILKKLTRYFGSGDPGRMEQMIDQNVSAMRSKRDREVRDARSVEEYRYNLTRLDATTQKKREDKGESYVKPDRRYDDPLDESILDAVQSRIKEIDDQNDKTLRSVLGSIGKYSYSQNVRDTTTRNPVHITRDIEDSAKSSKDKNTAVQQEVSNIPSKLNLVTVASKDDEYWDQMDAILADLETRGHTIVDNPGKERTWSPGVVGNAVELEDEEGTPYTLQFHTTESDSIVKSNEILQKEIDSPSTPDDVRERYRAIIASSVDYVSTPRSSADDTKPTTKPLSNWAKDARNTMINRRNNAIDLDKNTSIDNTNQYELDMLDKIDELYSSMSAAERKKLGKAMEEYRGWNFAHFRDALHGRKKPSAKLQQQIELLDTVTKQFDIPENTTLWRGMHSSDGIDLTPGTEFTDKSFVSTSLDKSVAASIYDNTDDREGATPPVLFKLTTKPGDKGAPAHMIGGFQYKDYKETHPNDTEREILLPKDRRFRIVGTHLDEEGRQIAEIEIVPQ